MSTPNETSNASATLSAADLDAYFARIGYDGSRAPTLDTLRAISAAHTQTIPFENLGVLLGERIALDPPALVRKLVHARRGGYCFEQNGLLLEVLRALGFRATPLSARVRLGRARSFTPARTHLFLRVDAAEGPFLVDCGVGGMSLTAPIRYDSRDEQPTPHETRRIVHDEGRFFHQALLNDGWTDIYEFTGEEMPLIDREVANWYTSAHPASHFKGRMMVARAAPHGVRLTVDGAEFTVRGKDGRATSRKIASPEELLEVLATEMGLRFAEGTRFGLDETALPPKA